MTSKTPIDVEFENWSDVAAYFARASLFGWIYRGLPDIEYDLVSKLERILSVPYTSDSRWSFRENLGISYFKQHASQYTDNLPQDEDLLGWLSLMQHYGAPTRLTDWTLSPFVGCYFAFEKQPTALHKSQNPPEAVLWMLNAAACRAAVGILFPFGRDHTGALPISSPEQPDFTDPERHSPNSHLNLENIRQQENFRLKEFLKRGIKWPLPLPILEPDPRMHAQQACFVTNGRAFLLDKTFLQVFSDQTTLVEERKAAMKLDADMAKQTGIKNFSTPELEPFRESTNPTDFIRRIRLPLSWRPDALRTLARMNITGATIYPGLDGLGKATATQVALANYPTIDAYFGNSLSGDSAPFE